MLCKGDVLKGIKFATIQKGVDESDEGDTVLVDSGIYFEFVDINRAALFLYSTNNPAL